MNADFEAIALRVRLTEPTVLGRWVHQDSNLEPIGYEPTALTIELWTRFACLSYRQRDKSG